MRLATIVAELEELGMAAAPGEEVGERRGSVGGMAGSLAAAKMLKKVQVSNCEERSDDLQLR